MGMTSRLQQPVESLQCYLLAFTSTWMVHLKIEMIDQHSDPVLLRLSRRGILPPTWSSVNLVFIELHSFHDSSVLTDAFFHVSVEYPFHSAMDLDLGFLNLS
ncbi:hypothetical protein TNCT_504051, partial [Trichonephila clavata]